MSLKEMFVGLTAAAVFCWCAAQFGGGDGGFWIVAGMTGLLALFWWMAARSSLRWLAALVPIVPAFFCGLGFGSLVLLVDSVLLVLVGVVCGVMGPLRGKSLAWVAMACFLASFVTATVVALADIRRFDALRAQHAVVSLAPRLEYEKRLPPRSTPALSQEVEQLLLYSERELRSDSDRNLALERLHSRSFDRFVRSTGFGVGRMARSSPEWIDRPAIEDISFSEPPMSTGRHGVFDWRILGRDGFAQDTDDLWLANSHDFLDPDGFGWTQEPLKKVAGFISHAFHAPALQRFERPAPWIVERLELVSLLKFDLPRVYVLDHLPRMDQLSGDDAPTRELDAFERRALPQLRTQEDVVIESSGDATRMLGSLRAGQHCLECHSVQRGELLGAFSYVLREEAMGEEREASEDGDAFAAE
jgi:hypothetical protein